MFSAITHVVPSHMMDRNLFDFETFKPRVTASVEGDTLFDGDSTVADFQSQIAID